ncbi:peroxidase family protein [Actinoplanes sp. NPDC049548]|uniref:peroxidase family protein n=1 Tax=Actinoplanes sp. NPDC049548 TaxID=3155152 RepID=UPI0034329DF7
MLITGLAVADGPAAAGAGGWLEIQSLDGRGNNTRHSGWGSSGLPYSRTAPARYADGLSAQVGGPNPRYLSNRIFNDSVRTAEGATVGVDVFSETQVSQWGWAWGQFLDHNIAMREGVLASQPHGEDSPIETVPGDPYDPVRNQVPFTRSGSAPGTGVTGPRQQVNMQSSYIDAAAVYGGTEDRLEWLREGPVDGDMSNNGARLLLPDDYLPVRGSRGAPDSAPEMELGGQLARDSSPAVVAGDGRANNNAVLTGIQTLFAREHNRIVGQLPSGLSEETKFQIARRVVISEIQYITYNEFLPAMGVTLAGYRRYDPTVDATVSNEFSTVGYRAHSVVHSNIPAETNADRYTADDIEALRRQGVQVTLSPDGTKASLVAKISLAQFNPNLVRLYQLGPLLQGVGLLPQYKNDEQVDILLRDVLCPPAPGQPPCLVDLAAIDVQRGRDHGMPSYNDLRRAYGLPARTSFAEIIGESSESFPVDPLLTPGDELNDYNSLDYTSITNLFGSDVGPINGPAEDFTAYTATRRTPLAARLKALYGSVDAVDALVGMMSEPHLPRSQLGELQQAIWTDQFGRLRDGDRFFYGAQQPALDRIRRTYGIDFRHSLGDLIAANTDIPRTDLADHVFFVGGYLPPTACRVSYRVTEQTGTGSGTFTGTMKVTNTGRTRLGNWIVRYRYADGQQVTGASNGVAAQNGTDVQIVNSNATTGIAPGQTRTVAVAGTWSARNQRPAGFNLNSTQCS